MKKAVLRPNFEKREGLIVAIVQDCLTKDILMCAFADEEAVRKTLEISRASFHSTSKDKLWIKGQESGNYMEVREVLIDCDGDAVIYMVTPRGDGLACHTGMRSCFHRNLIKWVASPKAPNQDKKYQLGIMETELDDALHIH